MLLDRTLNAVQAEGHVAATSSMTQEEINAAALFHAAGLINGIPETVGGGQVSLGRVALSVVPVDNGPILYDDINQSFEIEGAMIIQNDGPSNMSALLSIIQYARDGTDALAFLPNEMRRERIIEIARRSGASERFVRNVIANFQNISKGLIG